MDVRKFRSGKDKSPESASKSAPVISEAENKLGAGRGGAGGNYKGKDASEHRPIENAIHDYSQCYPRGGGKSYT